VSSSGLGYIVQRGNMIHITYAIATRNPNCRDLYQDRGPDTDIFFWKCVACIHHSNSKTRLSQGGAGALRSSCHVIVRCSRKHPSNRGKEWRENERHGKAKVKEHLETMSRKHTLISTHSAMTFPTRSPSAALQSSQGKCAPRDRSADSRVAVDMSAVQVSV
jgi:hypothetical protein